MKRKAYLCLRERYRQRKKSFVYVDESGFEPEVVYNGWENPNKTLG